MNGQTKLIEGLKALHHIKNDRALAEVLEVQPPVISKLRKGKLEIGASLLIKIHDTFNLSIKEIRAFYLEPAP